MGYLVCLSMTVIIDYYNEQRQDRFKWAHHNPNPQHPNSKTTKQYQDTHRQVQHIQAITKQIKNTFYVNQLIMNNKCIRKSQINIKLDKILMINISFIFVVNSLFYFVEYQGKQFDHLCSNIYKVYSIWEYPMRSLRDEVNQRVYQNRKFQEKEIWSILASSIFALQALQKNKIKHQCLSSKTILLDYNGIVKVTDPLALGQPTNLDTINRNRNTQSIYLSPEQCQALQSRGNYNNPFKSDVWALGLVILECGLLQSMSCCYKDEYQRIDYQVLQSKLDKFGAQYGEQLRVYVQNMLRPESNERPDWIDLAQYARKFQKNTSAMNSSQKPTSQLSNMKLNMSPSSKQDQSLSFILPNSLNKNVAQNTATADMKQYQGNLGASFGNNNLIQGDTLKQNTYQNPMTIPTFTSTSPLLNKNQNNITYQLGNNYQPSVRPLPMQNPVIHQQYIGPTPSFSNNYQPSTFQPLLRPTQYNINTGLTGGLMATQGNLFPNNPSTSTNAFNTNTFTGLNTGNFSNFGNIKGGAGMNLIGTTPGTTTGFNSISASNTNSDYSKPEPWRNIPTTVATSPKVDFLSSLNKPSSIDVYKYEQKAMVKQQTSHILSKPFSNISGVATSTSVSNPSAAIGNPTSASLNYLTSSIGAELDNKNKYTSPIYSKQNQSLFTPPSLLQSLTQPKSPLPYPYNKQTNKSNINSDIDSTKFVYGAAATTSNYYPSTTATAATTTTTTTNNSANDQLFNFAGITKSSNVNTNSNTIPVTNNSNTNTNPVVNSYNNFEGFNRSQGIGSSLKQYKPSQQGSKKEQQNPSAEFGPSVIPTQSLEQQIHTVQSNANNTYPDANLQQSYQPHRPSHEAPEEIRQLHDQGHNYVQNGQSQGEDHHSPNRNEDSNQSRAEFVIETFKQGSRYEGYKIRDMRHGHGKFYYQDGGMYDGNWSNNKMDGFGSLYYQSGELAYQGMWRQDQFQGKGKLFNEYPYALDQPFNYANFDQIDQFWSYYEGDFVEDFKKGKGKLMLSNGQYFEGTFNNDMVEGPGTFHRKNGQVIKGVWRQNHLVSQ